MERIQRFEAQSYKTGRAGSIQRWYFIEPPRPVQKLQNSCPSVCVTHPAEFQLDRSAPHQLVHAGTRLPKDLGDRL
jgi:hypothetical protein